MRGGEEERRRGGEEERRLGVGATEACAGRRAHGGGGDVHTSALGVSEGHPQSNLLHFAQVGLDV